MATMRPDCSNPKLIESDLESGLSFNLHCPDALIHPLPGKAERAVELVEKQGVRDFAGLNLCVPRVPL